MAKYFKIEELYRSNTAERLGIDNTPDIVHLNRLQYLADEVLDPLRAAWGGPLIVSSGYRSVELNNAVKGVKNSQHLSSRAVDIVPQKSDKFMVAKLFNLAVELDKQGIISCDQIIIEHRNPYGVYWVHISSKQDTENNRHQYFAMTAS